jgi:ABC-type transport system involved in cytochrome bd biosynthesis fused ATPase/permease subunit
VSYFGAGLDFLFVGFAAAIAVFICVRLVLRRKFSKVTKECDALYFEILPENSGNSAAKEIRTAAYTPEIRDITLVEQPFLFNMSVFENIKYGKIAASDEEVAAAAERAGILCLLSENSCEHLTAAERRLVAAARAILAEARKITVGRGLDGVDFLTLRGIGL